MNEDKTEIEFVCSVTNYGRILFIFNDTYYIILYIN